MKSFLFLSLLLGEIFVTLSVKGVTYYCVEANKTGTNCQCPDPDSIYDQCNTLQYFMKYVDTTINKPENKEANVTMIFMPGTHNVNFTGRINITAPASLTMKGLNHSTVTVMANRACYHPNNFIVDCGLLFECIIVWINDFTFHSVSVKLNYATVTLHNCLHLSQSLHNINHGTVIFSGESTFADSSIFTIYSSFGNITLSTGNITFTNNTAFGGGAMYLESSSLNIASGSIVRFSNNTALEHGGAVYLQESKIYIAPGAKVTFVSNSANDKGGAIYFEPGITLSQILSQVDPHKCFFYQSLDSGNTEATYINFISNTADNAGDDIYGASLDECSSESNNYNNNIIYRNESNAAVSLVSSDPLRVCICDDNNGTYVPQCIKSNSSREVFPGEFFNISVAVVGWDFNITNGVIYQRINSSKSNHVADGKKCTNLSYSLPSHSQPPEHIKMYLTAVNPTNAFLDYMLKCDVRYDSNCIHYVSVTYDITLCQCPPGFYLSNQRCDCYLHGEVFQSCSINNSIGYFLWNRTAWVSTTSDSGVVYAEHCPFDYCNKSKDAAREQVDIHNEVDAQCAYNRTGRLCGKCRLNENYSLAIGSSQCIQCEKDSGLALLIFFAAAGFLLVFFINVLNLTVTQGMINGLLYYANIIWAYQSILFPPQVSIEGSIQNWFKAFEFLRVFIAWLNLDFGIQMCFFKGLDAFGKTLLQYLFPIYLWIITGTIIICARYSTKITKLFGNRAVPVLATLFLISSTKILKIIIGSIAPTPLTEVSNGNNRITHIFWSLDGSYRYFFSQHAVIFLIAVFFFIVLWLPYTLLLFLMQWIRRKSHLKLFKWVPRLTPLYDTYFAPLKDKHHYWFGVLLVTRCALLIILMSTYTIYPKVNHILLLVTTALLLSYSNYYRVYKDKHVQLSESFFFLLLVLVGGAGVLHENIVHDVVRASVVIVLIVFFGLIICNLKLLSKICYCNRWKMRREYNSEIQTHLVRREDLRSSNTYFRDSIFDSQLVAKY